MYVIVMITHHRQ